MKKSIYRNLRRKIVTITLLVSFAPLVILGAFIYFQFAAMYRDKVEEQIRYRANAQAEAVDLFLKERSAILSAMADTHEYEDIIQDRNLSQIFGVMNLRAGAFVDLGVIDSDGFHRAYVGPYNLKGLNYYDQPWFSQVMSKGIYISDVFMGFRRLPHFIIAVRHQEDQRSWILRATIDPDILRDIVRSAKVGQTGDAFIVSRSGVYQTRPRFYGEVLWDSQIDTSLFGGRTTVIENSSAQGRKLLIAGSWLKNNDWLLVISQEAHEEMRGLFATRNIEIVIVTLGVLGIVLATVFTTGLTVRSLEAAHQKMDELNAQLMQTDKLAALGKMATGIAHEINNPLAVIGEKAGWMRDLLAEEEFQDSANLKEYQKSIEKIEEHVERVRKITHNMLGFARRMEPHLDNVDVNAVLNQTLELLQNHARINNIDIKKDLQTDLPVIATDQSQLQQVFLNLANNAIDAIGKDGTIDIVTRRTDQRIEVSIKDDGPGIPRELQRRIFDPFFTTKQTGKGTGLGLSISYSIIERMGGTISFSSKEGEGTEFRIFLPIQSPAKK